MAAETLRRKASPLHFSLPAPRTPSAHYGPSMTSPSSILRAAFTDVWHMKQLPTQCATHKSKCFAQATLFSPRPRLGPQCSVMVREHERREICLQSKSRSFFWVSSLTESSAEN